MEQEATTPAVIICAESSGVAAGPKEKACLIMLFAAEIPLGTNGIGEGTEGNCPIEITARRPAPMISEANVEDDAIPNENADFNADSRTGLPASNIILIRFHYRGFDEINVS